MGNIDKIVRANIKRMKSKEDDERMIKMISEQEHKRKKEIQEQKNAIVRKVNKDKIYSRKNVQSSANIINF